MAGVLEGEYVEVGEKAAECKEASVKHSTI